MQDVPSSVSVFDSRRVRQLHATTILDYAAYIPGLNVSSGGGPGQTMITLRGIAPVGPGAVVGYYVDDTPLGSSSNYGGAREFGLDLMPYDVERIEVLRGPQGTLYGAGAMGGLLKYVLRRPSVSDFEAWAGAETFGISSAADFGWGVRAGANVPLAAGPCRDLGQLLRTADAWLRGQRSHRRAGRERRRPTRRTPRVAVAG